MQLEIRDAAYEARMSATSPALRAVLERLRASKGFAALEALNLLGTWLP